MAKNYLSNIEEWHCGVFVSEDKDGVVVAEPRFIYKVETYPHKVCYWATVQELYDYNLTPLTKTAKAWESEFVGLTFNMNLCFLCPKISLTENPEPKQLREDGTIPSKED